MFFLSFKQIFSSLVYPFFPPLFNEDEIWILSELKIIVQVFSLGVHADLSPRDFNEWHMLDKENKHVYKWGQALKNRKSCSWG